MKKPFILFAAFLLGLVLLGCDQSTTESAFDSTTTTTLAGELPSLCSTFDVSEFSGCLITISLDPIGPILTNSEDRIVAITDGTVTIQAEKFGLSAYSLSLLGWVHVNGMGMNGYDMVENRAEIPTISWSEDLEIDLDANSTYRDLEVYDSEGTLLEEYDSLPDLSLLGEGFYFITIRVQHNKGNYSDQESFVFVCLFGLQK